MSDSPASETPKPTPIVRCAAGNDVRHHATYRCGPGCNMPVADPEADRG